MHCFLTLCHHSRSSYCITRSAPDGFIYAYPQDASSRHMTSLYACDTCPSIAPFSACPSLGNLLEGISPADTVAIIHTYIHISPFAFIYSLCMHTCEAFGQYGRQTLEPETCLCPRDRLYRRRTLAEYVVCYVSINSNKIIILTLGIRSMQTI